SYRFCVVTCTAPPLRKIASAIPLLADHFRELFNRQFKKSVKRIDPEVIARLGAWHSPGNVRELRNVIERALIFADGEVLLPEHLPPLTGVETAPSNGHHSSNGWAMPTGLSLAEVEKEYIRHT